MTCKLDHSDSDGIPQFLCRKCNPAGARSPPEPVQPTPKPSNQALAKAKRALLAETIKLDSMVATYGNAAATAITKQREKIARLEKKVAAYERGPTGTSGAVSPHAG